MIYLNNLNDFKLYKNKTIAYIERVKNHNKNLLLLHFSNNSDQIINFINNKIFYETYFKSYYIPTRFKTYKMKRLIKPDKTTIYPKISKSCPSIKLLKRNISDYKNYNLIYDYSYELNSNMEELKTMGSSRVNLFLNILIDSLQKNSYENKIIVVNVPEGLSTENLTVKKANEPFTFLYNAIKRKLISEEQQKMLEGKTILFYTNTGYIMKFNYSSEMKLALFNSAINRIIQSTYKDVPVEEVQEIDTKASLIKTDEKVKAVIDYISDRLKINQNQKNDDNIHNHLKNIEDKLYVKMASNNKDEMTEEEILDILNDEEIKEEVNSLKDIQTTGKADEKNISKLKEMQDKVSIEGKNIEAIFNEYSDVSIENEKIVNNNILNEEVKISNTNDFDFNYQKKQMKKDMVSVFTAFNNDSDVKLYLKDIKTENTSDILNKKITYDITFRDDRNTNHSIKLDVPIMKDGKFFLINGGKKIMLKQIFLLPIIKTKPDTVQITTNYNKLFVKRFGRKLSDNTERIKKFFAKDLADYSLSSKKFKYKLGSAVRINSQFITSLEYTELSSSIIFVETNDYKLDFNQSSLKNILEDENSNTFVKKLSDIKFDREKFFPIGYTSDKSKLLISDKKTGEVYISDKKEPIYKNISYMISELVQSQLRPEAYEELVAIKPSNTLTYSRVKINNKQIPLIVVLAYELGLKNVLEKYNVNYQFIQKSRVPNEIGKRKIKLSDGFLVFDSDEIRNTLLLDGLTLIPTEAYTFEQMNTQEPYIESFYELFGSRNIGKGIHNTLSLMVDPITLDVLKSLKLPTNIFDILLYANTLLEDSSFKTLNDMSAYRIRGSEQVVAVMYKILADSFKTYKDTLNAGSPIKMSVPRDILIKKLLELKTLDEYSILNPSLEIEKSGAVTYKGPSGHNLDSSYTKEIRSYHDSMRGILSPSTPDSDKTGVVRQLSYDARLLSTRGFLDTFNGGKNDNTNLFSSVELMNSYTIRHSDPPRMGMQSTQQKHIIPTEKQTKPLFGSGVEKTLPYLLSDDFVFTAKQDGIIEKVDEEKELVVIKYKDGTKDIIDLTAVMSKNSNGGFFTSNKKELMFKEGQKFKKQDILAKNPSYFVGNDPQNVSYTTGKLCKIALASADYTYEDSSIVIDQLAQDFTSKIVMKKEISLGKGANIDFLAKKGQTIKTGEPLITFESEFEDSSLNTLLDKLGDDFSETISDLSKNSVHSKYTGIVKDITIYYNRDLDEFSPSIRNILDKYISDNKTKYDLVGSTLNKDSDTFVNLKPIEKINSDKIKGQDVDGILIEFYIEYEDRLGVGDKISFGTAIKSVISDVIEKGDEPFSEYKPEEYVEAIFSPLSVISRMTIDVFFQLYLNKTLIGLKDRVREIFEEK